MTIRMCLAPVLALTLTACDMPAPAAAPLTGEALRDRLSGQALDLSMPVDGMDPVPVRIALRSDGTAVLSVAAPDGRTGIQQQRWAVSGDMLCVIDPDEVETGGDCIAIALDGDRVTTRETRADGSVEVMTGRITPL